MSLFLFMKLFHVLTGIWLISGILGRAITFSQAKKATELQTAHTLIQLSERFERIMVIPGSMAVLIFGLLTAWQLQMPLFGFLQGSPSNWLLVSITLYVASTFIVILFLAPRRTLRRKLTDEAFVQGKITPELTAALGDKVVMLARGAEMLIIFVVVVLMVLKPF